ncbi:MAG TPA: TetR/AcrR family transcriptional regulator [Acidimicrobiia bacterium]|nr:TetR/AcrR family transcriptional regulator [Acidimicrobiia bacterium]
MTSAPEPNARIPLTRERILLAAVAIADQGGLDSLTMRRLGGQLGVEAMSLYKHVASKEEVLDGIVDLVIGEIDLPPAEADWKSAMRHRAASARSVLANHPWAIGMMESRSTMGPAALRYTDAVIGSLRAAGFSLETTANAFLLLDSYVYGFVVQETSFPGGMDEETSERAGATLESLPDDRFPHLAEMARAASAPGRDHADAFSFGLELILDGLEPLRVP